MFKLIGCILKLVNFFIVYINVLIVVNIVVYFKNGFFEKNSMYYVLVLCCEIIIYNNI